MRTLALSLGLLAALPAAAQDLPELTWDWEGEKRFFLQAAVHMPFTQQFLAEQNIDVGVADYLVSFHTTCTPERQMGKKKFEVDCTIDAASLQARPEAGAPQRVEKVLKEWAGRYEGLVFNMIFTVDGRMVVNELQGLTFATQNRRTAAIEEGMRLVAERAFAALELELPRAGRPYAGGWTQKRANTAVRLPSNTGTAGLVKIEHTVVGVDGPYVDIESEGTGTTSIASDSQVARIFDVTYKGVARFDAEGNHLLAHVYTSEATLTASSVQIANRASGAAADRGVGGGGGGDGGRGAGASAQTALSGSQASSALGGGVALDPNMYYQVTRAFYVAPDEPMPDLLPTGLLGTEPEPEPEPEPKVIEASNTQVPIDADADDAEADEAAKGEDTVGGEDAAEAEE